MDDTAALALAAHAPGPAALCLELTMLEGRVQVQVPPVLVRQSAGLAEDCGCEALSRAFRDHAAWFHEAARGHMETSGWAPAIVLTEADLAGALQRLSWLAGQERQSPAKAGLAGGVAEAAR